MQDRRFYQPQISQISVRSFIAALAAEIEIKSV